MKSLVVFFMNVKGLGFRVVFRFFYLYIINMVVVVGVYLGNISVLLVIYKVRIFCFEDV